MNQQTGQDLDPKNREGRFPKEGGKQKKVQTEASWIMGIMGIMGSWDHGMLWMEMEPFYRPKDSIPWTLD